MSKVYHSFASFQKINNFLTAEKPKVRGRGAYYYYYERRE